jgi:hypothetical protein
MLPDWSDVEYDPEYNVWLVCDSDVWSTTPIASLEAAHASETFVMPKVSVYSGYAAGVILELASGSSVKTKRKQASGEEEQTLCKRRKLE